jgi:NAD+ diphosphatase
VFAPRVELPPPDSQSLWFVFTGDSLLVRALPDGSCTPLEGTPPIALDGPPIALGMIDARRCYAALADAAAVTDTLERGSLRALHARMSAAAFAAASLAAQLTYFAQHYRFCARCAAELAPTPKSRARTCTRCKHEWYPRVSPCAIVLVRDGDRLLMTRQARYPKGMYGLVAGFVEASESVEQCAERECLEECGVRITNLRYFGSQPWPFPHQLMMGFAADYAGGELVVDRDELEDARWFHRDELPLLPASISIARKLVDAFVERRL